jgi:hypothetical protein
MPKKTLFAISGKVTLKQADGSIVPIAGAVIDIYRTDFKQKVQVTTDRAANTCVGEKFVGLLHAKPIPSQAQSELDAAIQSLPSVTK